MKQNKVTVWSLITRTETERKFHMKLCPDCSWDGEVNPRCEKCAYNYPFLDWKAHLIRMAQDVNDLFGSEYKWLGSGWSRATYDLGDGTVAKVPHGTKHILTFFKCNREEHQWSQEGHPKDYPVAKTFGIEDWCGVPVLIMEKVKTLSEARKEREAEARRSPDWDPFNYNYWVWPWGEKPEWTERLWDGCQVGMNKDGQVVAYDFASNERV